MTNPTGRQTRNKTRLLSGLALLAGAIALGVTWPRLAAMAAKPSGPGASAPSAATAAGPGASSSAANRPPPLVSVVEARSTSLPIKLDTQGHLVTLAQVDVRPQASAIVSGVHFREGDPVSAGQLLFTLDAADATNQLDRARAVAAQVRAQLDDARREWQRSRQLAAEQFISSSVVDTAASKVATLEAQQRAALADIATAETAVGRTRIVAPIGGLSGQISVHPGSLAQPNATSPLVSLVQIDPIGVEFTLPEASLGDVLRARASDQVRVTLERPDGPPLVGKLVFVNNTVNTDSATVSLKASFPNPRRLLWPGGYVRLSVDAGQDKGAIVLPPQAVMDGPQGRQVFVVDDDNVVHRVPVTLLRVQDRQAVVQGLKGGERVVVEGNLGLSDRRKVRLTGAEGGASGAAAADGNTLNSASRSAS